MTRPQRVTVDELACASTGFCVRVAPDVFELSDKTGKAVAKVEAIDATIEAQAEEAEITCPTGAISLELPRSSHSDAGR